MVAAFPTYGPIAAPLDCKLHIVGSDTMAPMLSSAGISFQRIYPKCGVNIDQGGTSKGIAGLKAGTCDIASMARIVTDKELAEIAAATGKQAFAVSVGLDAICVYVNADNPLHSVSREQCNGLFSMTHSLVKEPILRWSDLDAASPLGAVLPDLYVTGQDSGTMQSFIAWCMPGEQFTTIGRTTEHGPSAVVNACCAYREAIGIAGYVNRQPRARMVPIDLGGGRPPVAPTTATIRDGSYPMTRPLNMVFVAPDREHIPAGIREFLRYLLSEDGQDMVAEIGMVPADASRMTDILGKPIDDIWQ